MTLSYHQRRAAYKRSLIAAKRYDAEAAEAIKQANAAYEAVIDAAVSVRMERDAAAHRDLDALKPGDLVRDSVGWHRVVRVNAKSVTVETPWSWTDRIPFAKVIETRHAGANDGVQIGGAA